VHEWCLIWQYWSGGCCEHSGVIIRVFIIHVEVTRISPLSDTWKETWMQSRGCFWLSAFWSPSPQISARGTRGITWNENILWLSRIKVRQFWLSFFAHLDTFLPPKHDRFRRYALTWGQICFPYLFIHAKFCTKIFKNYSAHVIQHDIKANVSMLQKIFFTFHYFHKKGTYMVCDIKTVYQKPPRNF